MKTIDEKAFYRCKSLEKIEIPSSVTHIAKYTFLQCFSLKEITLSSSTKSIDLLAFKGCSSLKNIKFERLPNNIGLYIFPFCTSLMEICQFPRFKINGNTIIREDEYVDINFITKDFSDTKNSKKYAINIVLGGSSDEKVALDNRRKQL